MSNITTAHTLDTAASMTFDPTDTNFDSDITDVQSALEAINSNALSPYPYKDYSTESVEGVILIASTDEIEALEDNTKAIEVVDLISFLETENYASETLHGIIELASSDDLTTGTDDSKALTIAKVDSFLDDNLVATEDDYGILPISTTSQATTGSDDASYMTPKKMLASIIEFAETLNQYATTTTDGIIRIATEKEVNNNVTNLQLTPYNLNQRAATTKKRSGLYLASSVTDSDQYAITPNNISSLQADEDNFGFFKLYDGLDSTDTDTALTANQGYQLDQDKIGIDGGTLNSDATLTISTVYAGSTSIDLMGDDITIDPSICATGRPVGSIYISSDSTFDPNDYFVGTWVSYSPGRVLVGAGTGTDANSTESTFTVNNTGGEYTHTLTTDELAKHKHLGMGMNSHPDRAAWGYLGSLTYYGTRHHDNTTYPFYSSPTGGDGSHNNIQPYVVFNYWRRTA